MNRIPRVIGRAGAVGAEPRLAIVGGLHGNEPAGALAATRVMREIHDRGVLVRGDLLALGGNLGALAVGRRYQVRDLNRAWTSPAMRHEVLVLQRDLERWARRCRPVAVVDLHAPGGTET